MSELSHIALASFDQSPERITGLEAMLDMLSTAAEQDWMETSQALVFRRDVAACEAVLSAALKQIPNSVEIRFALSGIWMQQGKHDHAQLLLREVVEDAPDHIAGRFMLARLLKDQGLMRAASNVIVEFFQPNERHSAELVIQAIEFLNDCGRLRAASEICENEIALGSIDPRLFAYAGTLLAQTGQFDLARLRREFAMANSELGAEWEIPLGLAEQQRYIDLSHKDVALFERQLRRNDISTKAKASLFFALGKVHDDVADYESAADYFRSANALIRQDVHWSRKLWRRSIEARITRKLPEHQISPNEWTPVFIVGMPRSGTTLLAELLSRFPKVCQRGELSWMSSLASQVSASGRSDYRTQLEFASKFYSAQLRQDDSTAQYFIDKQPHNFMHVDLILKMFPNARFLYCQRNARDNAVSLWTQSFQLGSQDFSYAFSDISATVKGSRQLMDHWIKLYPTAIHSVQYEDMVLDSNGVLDAISNWLGLPLAAHTREYPHVLPTSISTASFWQARQPIYGRSVGRWKNYRPFVPELLEIPDN